MSYSEGSIRKMLPKNYLRKHVAHDIFVATTNFKWLVPRMDEFVYNDGSIKDLMSLTGTLPVEFNDASYNIPVCLWLEDSYPQTPPLCYIKPTQDMMILRGNYTSSNGEVELPYLEDWKSGECDLMSLLQVMQVAFGDCPPVCMQPPSEPGHASCQLQYQRQAEVLSREDGSSYLSLPRDDGPPFFQAYETNC
ncbi:tumor susceptibility gene 101 protein isoform X1 [Platichthys flesus]|uniref:tumor susceptibility gene 101 protein isoform X1 n=1 Tax=Platichthys flesus TaxID=8260 RepID=UPI002DBF4B98|nr:tumor susceptibility gene 101 protein isoform X1 [Platichthys flesus]